MGTWERDRQRMTCTLVRLLRHNICWADKVDVCDAIAGIESHYDEYLAEQHHLHGLTDEPQQEGS